MRNDKVSAKASGPVQRKGSKGTSQAPPAFSVNASAGQTQATGSKGIPEEVKGKMESAFKADFSGVQIHKDSPQAEQVGALAFTQGSEIHFAPGQFNPTSQQGQELLGHELAHVKQQREGQVPANAEVGGMPLNQDPKLEEEAEKKGKLAAAGKDAEDANAAKTNTRTAGSSGTGPVQRFQMRDSDLKKYPRFAEYVRNEVPKISNDGRLSHFMNKHGQNQGNTARNIPSDVSFGSGPMIVPRSMEKANSSFRSNQESEILRVSRLDIENYEKANPLHEHLHRLALEAHIVNAYTQYLDDQDGKDNYGKEGVMVEEDAYGKDIKHLHDARNANETRFGKGEYKVTVLSKSAGFAQRVVIWGAEDGYTEHAGSPGASWTVKSKPFGKWRLQIESNEDGKESVKGWKKSRQLTTEDGKDTWTVRSEDWKDADRNDLTLRVQKVG